MLAIHMDLNSRAYKENENTKILSTLPDISIQEDSKFKIHLIENGSHFFLISKIYSEKNLVFFQSTKYSYEDIHKKCPNSLSSRAQFIEDLSEYPTLEIGKLPCSNVIKLRNFPVYLSREIQDGINGIRDQGHHVPFDTLQKCIQKKEKQILKSQPDTRESFYFFDLKQDRVLQLVFQFGNKCANLLTAFYVGDAAMKQRLSSNSDAMYAAFKEGLPKI